MGSGSKADNKIDFNAGINGLNQQAEQIQDPRLAKIMQQYQSGGMSLQDALSNLYGGAGTAYDDSKNLPDLQARRAAIAKQLEGETLKGALGQRTEEGSLKAQLSQLDNEIGRINSTPAGMGAAARTNEFFTNALTGTKAATEQVQNNPLLSNIFGKGGMNDRLDAEERDLASRGWSLTPEDNEAYGAASDEIARLSGQEDASLASVLAGRGIASGSSGAAAASYSGLAGNKTERLKASQMQLADMRMKTTMERLSAVRNFALQGNQQAQQAIGDQFKANMAGSDAYSQKLKDSVMAGQAQQGQLNQEFEQREATKGPGVGEIAGGLLGTAAGSLAGGIGSSLGGALGQKLGGLPKKA